MRNNQPVMQNDFSAQESQELVSKTDVNLKASKKYGLIYYGRKLPNQNLLIRFTPILFLMLSTLLFSAIAVFLTIFGQLSLASGGALLMSLGLMAVIATYGLFLQSRVKQDMRNLCRISSQTAPQHLWGSKIFLKQCN